MREKSFLAIGHRGAAAYATENTLESFQKAIELGANAIECDVRRTKDGEIVVIHDDNLQRVFGKNKKVEDIDLSEAKELTNGEIPTLKEALAFMGKKVDKILVELKEAGFEKEVLEVVSRQKLASRVIVLSFHEQALRNVRKADKNIETGFIYANRRDPVKLALHMKAQYIDGLYRFLHTRTIERAHDAGLLVLAWTINSRRDAKKYAEKGVDGIASDKPDILANL